MGIVNIGFDENILKAQIVQAGQRAVKHGIEVMRDVAEDMAQEARNNAPHDEGKLEEAIKVDETGGGRTAGGRFLRKEVQVYVDGDMPGSGGMAVGDYAYLMHEGLGPYGDYTFNLGPNSRAKASVTGFPVGGKFLQRAVDKFSEGLRARLQAMYDKVFK